MLRDAPLLFLAATAVVPLLAVAVLELEAKISAVRPWLFATSISVIAVLYVGFVGYAVGHASNELAIARKLDLLRSKGLTIQERPQTAGMNPFEYADWKNQIEQWRNETAKYLEDYVGDAAKTRFLSTSGRLSMSYGGATPELNTQLNLLDWRGKNLQEIIDTRSRVR